MSSTRSPSTAAPATEAALIVAHGSPSAPEGQEAVLQALARDVAARMSAGALVRGTTLAMKSGLRDAVEEIGAETPLKVYPLFMADGWFVSSELPRRLERAGARRYSVLPSLGLDPRVHRLALRRAMTAARRLGDSGEVGVLLAAHGSPSDPRPARAARRMAEVLSESGAFREVREGFVDEEPYLADAARGMGAAICLPFFATRAGHVEHDLPEALAEADFTGPTLPPIGTDPVIPALIARALRDTPFGGSLAAE